MRMSNVLGLILGGGKGTRLYPLTRDRAKPAVPLAGKYRLIDIPMSNCLNSGIQKIALLTQFNSVSLHRHIHRTYTRDYFTKGWVQVLAAEQSFRSDAWYQGTADAVRKQWIEIRSAETEHVLILAGDHLYRMDYRKFAEFHEASGADITVAVQPVTADDAPALGILKLNEEQKIVSFREKPKREFLAGLESNDDPERPYMGSMGIYMFKTRVLAEVLDSEDTDFGSEIIPHTLDTHKVMGYPFEGFWEDIGTMKRFFEVNLMMAQPSPPFNFYSEDAVIYTRPRFLPTSKIHGAHLNNVLVADGCRVSEAEISNAVIGLRSRVDSGVRMESVVLLGNDVYESDEDMARNRKIHRPNVGVGPNSQISYAIIDKNARIGEGVVIRSMPDRPDEEHDNWVSRDGIVIIPKNAIIHDGMII